MGKLEQTRREGGSENFPQSAGKKLTPVRPICCFFFSKGKVVSKNYLFAGASNLWIVLFLSLPGAGIEPRYFYFCSGFWPMNPPRPWPLQELIFFGLWTLYFWKNLHQFIRVTKPVQNLITAKLGTLAIKNPNLALTPKMIIQSLEKFLISWL